MLVVRIEMWPLGDRTKAREIGRTYIANVGGTDGRGDYEVAVCRKDNFATPRNIFTASGVSADSVALRPWACREAQVKDYPRLSYNVWRLVSRALRAAFPEEK